MKNLTIFHQLFLKLDHKSFTDSEISQNTTISSYTSDYSLSQLLFLSTNGFVYIFNTIDSIQPDLSSPIDLNSVIDESSEDASEIDHSWFYMASIQETSQIVCISHLGNIVSIKDIVCPSTDHSTSYHSNNEFSHHRNMKKMMEHEGCIDGGIYTAQWNPEFTILVMVTKNNTIISMTSSFEVVEEIPFSSISSSHSVSITWSSDSNLFAIVSTTTLDDGTPDPVGASVKIYSSKDYTLQNIGRNVTATGSGPAMISSVLTDGSTLKGLGNVVAFSGNGTYIAVPQQRVKDKLQVTLLEPNGFAHGGFGLQLPPIPSNSNPWIVIDLHWDLSSNLLAVSMISNNNITTTISSSSTSSSTGIVQIYYRSNYHWYLKQQFQGSCLKSLGFDNEYEGRIFLTESRNNKSIIHVIDLTFEVNSSQTREYSVAVIDGCNIRLSPLGISTIPPPMYTYTVPLSSPCRYSSFWSNPMIKSNDSNSNSNIVTIDYQCGIACLSFDSIVTITLLNAKGKPMQSGIVDLKEIMDSSFSSSSSSSFDWSFWSIVATSIHKDHIQLTVVGAPFDMIEKSLGWKDYLIIIDLSLLPLHNDLSSYKYSKSKCKTNLRSYTGAIGRVAYTTNSSNIYHENTSPSQYLTVSISSTLDLTQTNGMEVVIIDTNHPMPTYGNTNDDNSIKATEYNLGTIRKRYTIPEVLIQFYPIPIPVRIPISSSSNSLLNDSIEYMIVGMSAKHRLYCGETMLMSAVSSYTINWEYNMLLFVTMGSKPMLHFIPVARILSKSNTQYPSMVNIESTDPTINHTDHTGHTQSNQFMLQLGDEDEGQLIQSLQCIEPRPVERGSKLIATIPSGYKVILQMPRGNLEAFEPRVLVLLHAKQLILQSQSYYECILLLRRQRVDLNMIVDYNPILFVSSIDKLIDCIVSNKAMDILSLFVSSLDDSNVIRTKYPTLLADDHLFSLSSTQSNENITESGSIYQMEGKVNYICRQLREGLERYIAQNITSISILLHPILCTYAKQQPAKLVEALKTLRQLSTSSSMTDSALKYLAFLAEGKELFEAALSQCDFQMAKAIGRETQMDPKQYISLLENFESIGRGYSIDSYQYHYMNFRVHVYLNRYTMAVEYAMKTIGKIIDSMDTILTDTIESKMSSTLSSTISLEVLCKEIIDIVIKHSIYDTILPMFHQLERSHLSIENISILTGFMNQIYLSYGIKCVSNQLYSNAIIAFLSQKPPNALDAIRAATYDGNWTLALTLSSRYENSNSNVTTVTSTTTPTPRKLAYEIVTQYKEGLQQIESTADPMTYVFSNYAMILSENTVQNNSGNNNNNNDNNNNSNEKKIETIAEISSAIVSHQTTRIEDKALEAARICMDYCQDIEDAVAILLLARRWVLAIQFAFLHNRRDLFDTDITSAVRSFGHTVLKLLPQRSFKHQKIVTELQTLWKNPEERLQQVSSTDTLLLSELQGDTTPGDDTKSEYSLSSELSYSSRVSGVSSVSKRSGMSSVSILSNLSTASSVGSNTSKKINNFAIEGLDHTLLSRGGKKSTNSGADSVFGGEGSKRYGKKEKRENRRRVRGEGKDIWGIRREGQICHELWLLADIASVAKTIDDLCDVLLVVFPSTISNSSTSSSLPNNIGTQVFSKSEGQELASRLHQAMDEYTSIVLAYPPPIAPNYPIEWLKKRLMSSVIRFQDKLTTNLSQSHPQSQCQNVDETWWKVAADGIQLWRKLRKTSLITSSKPINS